MTSTDVNLVIYDNFLAPRFLQASGVSISVDNTYISINVSSINDATNIGPNGPFAQKTNQVLMFKSLTNGSFVNIQSNNSLISISASYLTTIITGATNGLYDSTQGDLLIFKNLTAVNPLSLTTTDSIVGINFDPTALVANATNIGGNTNGIFLSKTANQILLFKNLVGGSFITLASNNSIISLNATVNASTIVTGATNLDVTGGPVITVSISGILIFKDIVGGTGIAILNNNSMIRVNVSPGTITLNGATNIGGVLLGVYFSNNAGTLTFKPLSALSYVLLSSTTSTIMVSYINTQIYVTGATNGLYAPSTDVLQFKTIQTGSFINITNLDSSIVFNSASPGSTIFGSGSNVQNITTALLTSNFVFSTILSSTPSLGIDIMTSTDRYKSSYVYNLTTSGFSLATRMYATNYNIVSNTTVYLSMQLLPNRRFGIAYYDNNYLQFALNSLMDATGAWSINTVDSTISLVGQYPSLAASFNDNPIISYYDGANGDLKFAYSPTIYGSGIWTKYVVDNTGNVGQYSSLALMGDGMPAVAYYDVTGPSLKFAYNNMIDGSGTWTLYTVYNVGNVGQYASLANLTPNIPGIAFYDATNNNLMFARNANTDGSGVWTNTTVDALGDVGQYASLAVLPTGFPAIAYYDATNQFLKYATNDASDGSGTWTITLIDTTSNVGQYASLKILSNGNPAVSYYDATNDTLKLAINNSGVWSLSTVDQTSGTYSSLGTTYDGNISIAYRANSTLKIANSFASNSFPTSSASFVAMWLATN